MKYIQALIAQGGSISLGALDGVNCVAAASDAHNALAVLVRRDGQTFAALLERLDQTVGRYYDSGATVNEVNPAGG